MKKLNDIFFPDCWEEVTPAEWQQLLLLRHKLITMPGVTLIDIKRAWCAFILHERERKLPGGTQFMLLIDQLADTLNWVFTVHEDNSVELTYTSTVNLLPVWRGFVGPQNHGADLTFGEFRHAVVAFNNYTASHQPMDLLALCAILYRHRVKVKGMYRRPAFNADQLDLYINCIRKMPEYLQWGVYAWFAYFCQYTQMGDFIIDGSTVCFAPIFTSQGGEETKSGQNIGLNAIRYTVAESGVFGDARATDDTPLLQVLLKLLDDKQRADDLLQHTKSK